MTSITVFAYPAAMTTTQLTNAECHEVCARWQLEPKAKPRTLRMSWVVVTDEHGRRVLRSQWSLADDRAE